MKQGQGGARQGKAKQRQRQGKSEAADGGGKSGILSLALSIS